MSESVKRPISDFYRARLTAYVLRASRECCAQVVKREAQEAAELLAPVPARWRSYSSATAREAARRYAERIEWLKADVLLP